MGGNERNRESDAANVLFRVILVVEDDTFLREAIVTLLRDFNWEVYEASDGIEALARMRQHPVEIVLTDLQMPRMDGVQLLGHLREIDPELPVVVLTGFGTTERCAQALRAGATDFLLKPCEDDDLLAALDEAWEAGRANGRAEPFQIRASGRIEMTMPAATKMVSGVVAQVEAFARAAGYYTRRWGIRRALREALDNAVRHGARGKDDRDVRIIVTLTDEGLALEIEDPGAGFPLPAAWTDAPLTSASHGLELMRCFADRVTWHPPGNRVEMVFLRVGSSNTVRDLVRS